MKKTKTTPKATATAKKATVKMPKTRKTKTATVETPAVQTAETATVPTETKVLKGQALRLAQLREISQKARQIKESLIKGAETPKQREAYKNRPLNYFIYNCVYGATKVYKTFEEWKKEGASINKGVKAYLIWGQPIAREQASGVCSEPEMYYPILHVFSSDQVTHKGKPQADNSLPF
ncbi:hypothetical protein LJC68_06155 [Bacteroidales bacterium OttesenSCG-928-B11]|nr:hypothetical protein [Bacteroidales bacterium OttesenSCG-928-B11]